MKKVVIVLSVIFVFFVVAIGGFYLWGIGAKNNSSEIVNFIIDPGTSKTTIAKNLENAGLIRSQYALDIYLFFARINIQAGEYELSANMTPLQMLEKFESGDIKLHTVDVTLVEGNRLVDYANSLAKDLTFTADEFIKTVDQVDFVKKLMENEDYWFLTEDILDTKIYHPLEGYLYPDTYEFLENATPEEVVQVILNATARKLEPYKEELLNGTRRVHEYFTMASIVEKEANSLEDRQMASQVFYSRLGANWSLGSDVTAYYGVNKVMGEDISITDLNNPNAYNTRLTDGSMNGKLPIGPISNPSVESLEAALRPASTNYMFFVANVCTGEVFFQETSQEFYNKVYELQAICDKN